MQHQLVSYTNSILFTADVFPMLMKACHTSKARAHAALQVLCDLTYSPVLPVQLARDIPFCIANEYESPRCANCFAQMSHRAIQDKLLILLSKVSLMTTDSIILACKPQCTRGIQE